MQSFETRIALKEKLITENVVLLKFIVNIVHSGEDEAADVNSIATSIIY